MVVHVSTITREFDASADGEQGINVDGRRARRQRNRDAVVEALLELYHEGNFRPSAEEIAERAGLSPRSLFRYFDDVDDLTRAAIARHLARLRPLFNESVDPTLPLPERVAAFVENRLRLHDASGNVGQIARMRSAMNPVVGTELGQARSSLRNQLQRTFEPDLAKLGEAHAANVLATVDALCSFEVYRLMRNDQRLSRSRAAAAVVDSMIHLLAP
jgi:AcrR family transcriptional regulator